MYISSYREGLEEQGSKARNIKNLLSYLKEKSPFIPYVPSEFMTRNVRYMFLTTNFACFNYLHCKNLWVIAGTTSKVLNNPWYIVFILAHFPDERNPPASLISSLLRRLTPATWPKWRVWINLTLLHSPKDPLDDVTQLDSLLFTSESCEVKTPALLFFYDTHLSPLQEIKLNLRNIKQYFNYSVLWCYANFSIFFFIFFFILWHINSLSLKKKDK